MLLPLPAEPAGLEELLARLVDRRGVVRDRTDEREPIHPGRQPGQVLVDPDARDPGRDRAERPADLLGRLRLGVPGLKLTRARPPA